MRRYLIFLVALALSVARASESKNEKSTEERARELEIAVGSKEQSDEDKRQLERDFNEICAMGLHTRALKEFSAHLPGSIVKRWTVGYFKTKEVVWFSFFYLPNADAKEKQLEFGFRKKGDTWELMWPEPPRDLHEKG